MNSKPQLFCFTFAGGTASFFDYIDNHLGDYELIKLEYSGHGVRHKEPLYTNFDELADDMYSIIRHSYKGGKYALFGYSMGTISVVEVLSRIIDDQLIPLPDNVFLAAHEPITKGELVGYSDSEIDDWVKDRTIKFGAVPDSLLENKCFWRIYIPLLRADYSIIGKYRFENLSMKVNIPTTIFYSEADTPYSNMEMWKNYFTGSFDYIDLTGPISLLRTTKKK